MTQCEKDQDFYHDLTLDMDIALAEVVDSIKAEIPPDVYEDLIAAAVEVALRYT